MLKAALVTADWPTMATAITIVTAVAVQMRQQQKTRATLLLLLLLLPRAMELILSAMLLIAMWALTDTGKHMLCDDFWVFHWL